jgi:hypothetical protein
MVDHSQEKNCILKEQGMVKRQAKNYSKSCHRSKKQNEAPLFLPENHYVYKLNLS